MFLLFLFSLVEFHEPDSRLAGTELVGMKGTCEQGSHVKSYGRDSRKSDVEWKCHTNQKTRNDVGDPFDPWENRVAMRIFHRIWKAWSRWGDVEGWEGG